MRVELTKEFRFEAAHYLPRVAPGHRCRRLHGHSYRVEVSVVGHMNEELGWIIDLGDVSDAFAPLLKMLDHSCLNEIAGLENPTSENLAIWVLRKLQVPGARVSRVTVRETTTSLATVYAD